MAKKSKRNRTPAQTGPTKSPEPNEIALLRPSWSTPDWLWSALLVLLVILAYLPIWQAGFMWDDDAIVTANPVVGDPHGLKAIWTSSEARFYPFVLSTFWLEHELWGFTPLPFHLVNLAFHAGCAVVLWRALRALKVPGAWIGAALWALHPVQVESAAWISETKNTESCFFYLLTILFFVKGLNSDSPHKQSAGIRYYALSLLFAVLAMASKSSTLILPIVLALCVWWVKGRWQWRDLSKVGLFLLVSAAAGLLTSQSVRQNGTNELQWAQTWQERILLAGYEFWFYLGKLLWPHPLINFYPGWEIDTGSWLSYLPMFTVVLVPVCLWFTPGAWSRACFFAFIYYLINLVPVSGLLDVKGFRYSVVEDHLQYLAGMGPLALAGAGLYQLSSHTLSRMRGIRFAPAATVLLVLSILSWRQTWHYQNAHALWVYSLAQNPDCGLAYDGLALELVAQGKVDEAIQYYQRSLTINPGYAMGYTNLALAYVQKNNLDEAIAQYQKSLALNAQYPMTHIKYGEALLKTGHLDEAMDQYQEALRINPRSALAYNNLGLADVQKGTADEAITQYQKALEIDPNFALAHQNLGVALFQQGRTDEAIAQYQSALKTDPQNVQTRNNLGLALTQAGVAYLKNGQMDEAVTQFQAALKNDPDIPQVHSDLGIVYAQKGQIDEALSQFQEALRLKPDDAAAQVNLAKIKAMLQQRATSP